MNVCTNVWVDRGVQVHVYKCIGVQVYGGTGVHVYVWVYKCMGVQVYVCTGVYNYIGVQVLILL